MAASMAILVLLTTMSFTVDMHYCGESLIDFSVIQNAKTCGMEKSQSENDCEITLAEDSCCTNKQLVVEGQDELKLNFDKITFEQQAFVATFFYTYIGLFEGLDTQIIPFKNYSPPFLERDLQKLHETYLI